MLSGCSQLIWAHSHLMWFLIPGYSQLMWSRKTDVIGSGDLCYRAATVSAGCSQFFIEKKQQQSTCCCLNSLINNIFKYI